MADESGGVRHPLFSIGTGVGREADAAMTAQGEFFRRKRLAEQKEQERLRRQRQREQQLVLQAQQQMQQDVQPIEDQPPSAMWGNAWQPQAFKDVEENLRTGGGIYDKIWGKTRAVVREEITDDSIADKIWGNKDQRQKKVTGFF